MTFDMPLLLEQTATPLPGVAGVENVPFEESCPASVRCRDERFGLGLVFDPAFERAGRCSLDLVVRLGQRLLFQPRALPSPLDNTQPSVLLELHRPPPSRRRLRHLFLALLVCLTRTRTCALARKL